MSLFLIITGLLTLALIALFGPQTVALMGIVGLAGATLHEVAHAVVAVVRGHTITAVGWDSIGPYVEYDSEIGDRLVTAAPLLVGVGMIGLLAVQPGLRSPLVVAFILPFVASPTDWVGILNV